MQLGSGLVALLALLGLGPSMSWGAFLLGGALPSPCPPDMAYVDGFCIDRYEASLVETLADGTERAWSPYRWPHADDIRAVSRPSVVPQAYISWDAARRACKASDKRLCSSAEWGAACRGSAGARYPYGETWIPGTCTDSGRTMPLGVLYSGAAMFENRSMIDARLNQLPNTVAKTGEAKACTAGNGTFDMVGNVNEWVQDATLHGGFYLDVRSLGEGCGYSTKAHHPVYFDYSTGFRCCRDPE